MFGTALGCLENVPTIFGVKIPSPTIESQKDVQYIFLVLDLL
jgi:hypothetical protein